MQAAATRRRYLEFQIDAIASAISDHRTDGGFACDLAPFVGLAQMALSDLADVIDQPASGRRAGQ